MDIDLLCDKEGAAGGCGVLWVELALGIALEETCLANARVTHDDDLAVDAVVNEGRISLHGEGRPAAQRKKKRFEADKLNWAKSALMASTRTTRDILSTPATLPGTQIRPPSLSAAGTQTRTSPAYTPATSHPSSPGICPQSAAQQPEPTHVHFQQFGSINRNSGPFSDNLRGENKILQDLFVHTCQRSAARSLLLDPRFTSRAG